MPRSKEQLAVLVVEDNDSIRMMLGTFLENQGLRCWLVGGGAEALQVYIDHAAEIGALLCDVQLPDWDGPQTMRAVRELNPTIEFCFMTADSGSYTIEDLSATGAVRVFKKPFESLAEVGRTLHDIMARSSARLRETG